nr:acyltransferase [Algoriphagus sp.]
MEEKYIKHRYEPILPSKDEWPVVKLARERKEFVSRVSASAQDKILTLTGKNPDILKEELETTLYREKLRIKQNPWVVDPDDEGEFWGKVKAALLQINSETKLNRSKRLEAYKEILERITNRYSEEIASNFNHQHYKFTRSVVTYGFSRLLNAARVKGFKSI